MPATDIASLANPRHAPDTRRFRGASASEVAPPGLEPG